ncbi:MAG: biotin/lipoyl-binding protein, partial [Gammaproteobacteria bacterium]|nr:biotin/lipoyl-binding protein [Gammaproteobacteria bacterium]
QVPGGMLTNMESQLKEQNALDKMDEVLLEIPRVRKDLGYIPLVTPTSQIVGTQSVLNVLTGERYKTITRESAGILKGEYGSAPAPVNKELQERVLEGAEAITCRPADNIEPELDVLESEFDKLVLEKGIRVADEKIDDLLTYALFPQVGIKFLENRDNPDFFEPVPQAPISTPTSEEDEGIYTVSFKGQSYTVNVSAGGTIKSVGTSSDTSELSSEDSQVSSEPLVNGKEDISAPLSGTIWKILVSPNQNVKKGDTLLILEAMKMETEIKATQSGVVLNVGVKEGDSVTVGQLLFSLG